MRDPQAEPGGIASRPGLHYLRATQSTYAQSRTPLLASLSRAESDEPTGLLRRLLSFLGAGE